MTLCLQNKWQDVFLVSKIPPHSESCSLGRLQMSYKWKLFGRVWLFATARTTQSTAFSRPEHCSGWPFPSSGGLPNPGDAPRSPTWPGVRSHWAKREEYSPFYRLIWWIQARQGKSLFLKTSSWAWCRPTFKERELYQDVLQKAELSWALLTLRLPHAPSCLQ